jgi:putative membrane protein
MNMSKLGYVTAIAIGLAASGCSKGSSASESPGASQGSEATPPETSETGKNAVLTDGQILQILAAVDNGEIEQAQVALTKTSNPPVRDFANMMIEQHTASKQHADQLASQTKIIPSPSARANKLQTDGSHMLEKLNAADPSDFDKLYIEAQIDQHKDVLEMLNDKLIPAAKEPMLKQQLTTTQNMVQHHIDRAKQISL